MGRHCTRGTDEELMYRSEITTGDLHRMTEAIKAVIPIAWTLAQRIPNGKQLTSSERDQLGLPVKLLPHHDRASPTVCGSSSSHGARSFHTPRSLTSVEQEDTDSSVVSDSGNSGSSFQSPWKKCQRAKRPLKWKVVKGVRPPAIS